jgi:AcrR family transcriptional regulator
VIERRRTLTNSKKTNLRQEQAAETRRKLLNAARKCFAANGYDATPIRSINREIGMADGLLYHYFPGGKREMLQVLIEEESEKMVPEFQRLKQSYDDLSVDEVASLVCREWFALFCKMEDILVIMLRQNKIMNLIEPDLIQKSIFSVENWFPDFLRKRAEKGEIREMDYYAATEALQSVVISRLFFALTGITSDTSWGDAQEQLVRYQVSLWK